ncbi:MAG: N-acetyl-alpha-D-glucosaminyl L-malate synthase BshA [Candidatus Sumerlaeia bacterium]|nr:N-acetyl-alpha-D-glucosaminyl L-malate synthase BshA [Candidatus Sumerlaeia bacterium]
MNIGIVCYPLYGGSGVVAAELGLELAKRGHEIHVISYSMPFRLKDAGLSNLYFHSVDLSSYHVFVSQPYTLTLAVKIAEVIEREGLDIVHVHYAIPHTISALLARQLVRKRFKIITTLHGTDITLVGAMPGYRPMVKLALAKSDAITCVSNWLKERTLNCFRTKKSIQVIYNFIDVNRFKPLEKRGKLPSVLSVKKEKVIVHLSNFRPVKRVADLIRAFAIINDRIKSVLVLIGDGPEHSLAIEMAKNLGVYQQLRIMGQVEHPETILPYADLFILPSESESFGLGAAEAMSCGVPVIGTRCGGLAEVIDDGVNGYLVPIGNYQQIAEKAVQILKNPDLQATFGKNARAKITRYFPSHKIIGQYELLYYKLLELHKKITPAG